MNFSFGAGAAPAAGGSTGFSFGSTPAATTTTATGSSFSFRVSDPSQVSDQPSRSRVQKLSLGLQFYILNFTLHNIRYFVGGAEGLKGFFMT